MYVDQQKNCKLKRFKVCIDKPYCMTVELEHFELIVSDMILIGVLCSQSKLISFVIAKYWYLNYPSNKILCEIGFQSTQKYILLNLSARRYCISCTLHLGKPILSFLSRQFK